ncbi:TetR/AcrR family transcriptional regulator C-terminal domain-containing protein [Nocardia noduli]|uniref:TetR/AcrR family transcriptional regulator C-terminal domain-containing protein n=1 Tax=Nocardia noduli TaxID=2815722 RepID=UPI001C2391A2|nr:TetR/AcrR family transcriptional regulator C-terminal domain-containing protein [Nocardia noduli]
MSSQSSSDAQSRIRGANVGGRPPKLSRERIVAAARTLNPETLTMNAVAEALDVHRKSLNYYVRDREGLLLLLAFDAFETESARMDLSAVSDWRELLRTFSMTVANSLIDVGVLIPYVQFAGRDVRFEGGVGLHTVAVIERIVRSLTDAGFEAIEASRIMRILAVVGHTAAQEVLGATQGLVVPREGPVLRTVDTTPTTQFPSLRGIASAHDTPARVGEQFAFDLDLVIAGLEVRLRRHDSLENVERPAPHQSRSGRS